MFMKFLQVLIHFLIFSEGENIMNIAVTMALIIISIILSISLKSKSPEISNIISIGIGLTIIAISVTRIDTIIQVIRKITTYISIDKLYINILLKLIGVSYICEFAASISKDAGFSSIASQIELVGKLTMLMISLPVILNVIETIANMLE